MSRRQRGGTESNVLLCRTTVAKFAFILMPEFITLGPIFAITRATPDHGRSKFSDLTEEPDHERKNYGADT
jgi:hypothetical protein